MPSANYEEPAPQSPAFNFLATPDQNCKACSNPAEQPLHIALTGYRSHPHVGGQGIYLRQLATALDKLGHRVTVISGPPYPDLPEHIQLVRLDSLDLYSTDAPFRALRLRHLFSFTDFYEWLSRITGGFAEPYTFGRRLKRYLSTDATSFDVIHDNQALCWSLLALKSPVVATIHHPITRDREQAIAAATDWLHRWGAKRWYSFVDMQAKVTRQLDYVVTVSESSRHDIESCFGRAASSTEVIFNGIDTELFKPLPHIQRQSCGLLTTCSSDQPVKGFEVLLRAYSQLLISHPNTKLTVIGTLKNGGRSARLLKELKLEARVIFRSNLSDRDMVEAYNTATLYICPSLYEGFGLPVAEALSCGTPVISSNGGALPEVVGAAGVLVPAGDARALAAAIADLLDNPDTRLTLSQAGRQRALATFCWNRVAEKYEVLYRKAIKNSSKICLPPSLEPPSSRPRC